MEEVYTCPECGCQAWIIHQDHIVCGGCGKKYNHSVWLTPEKSPMFMMLDLPFHFNKKAKDINKVEKITDYGGHDLTPA